MNFDFLRFMFAGDDNVSAQIVDTPLTVINPATSLPMVENGMCGLDIGGSLFGMDNHSSLTDSPMDYMDMNTWE